MALGSGHQTVTTAAKFVPEVWSDEVVATYKKQLVAAKDKLYSKNFRGA